MPTTWPFGERGFRAWPGPWAFDPRTRRTAEGRFVSDQHVFLAITDSGYADRTYHNATGYSIGALVLASVHAFADSLRAVWSSGDGISVREPVAGRPRITWVFVLRRPDPQLGVPSVLPQPGDVLRIVTARPYRTGDCLRLETAAARRGTFENSLSEVHVVPNPYVVNAGWDRGPDGHRVAFVSLPSDCTIRIYTLAGELVRVLEHYSLKSGTEFWDLKSSEGMEVSYGLYLYVVETPDGKKKVGKFGVLR